MSVTITAASILAQNQYTTTDFDNTDVEYMIDDAIDTVNQLAQQSIAAMAGVPGSLTATLTRAQSPAVKTLLTIMLREAKKTSLSNSSSTSGSTSTSKSKSIAGVLSVSEGGSVGTAISATSALNNAANSPLVELFYKLIESLKTNTSYTKIAFSVGHDTSTGDE